MHDIVFYCQFLSSCLLYVSKINVIFNTYPKIYEGLSPGLFLESVINNLKLTNLVTFIFYTVIEIDYSPKWLSCQVNKLVHLFDLLMYLLDYACNSNSNLNSKLTSSWIQTADNISEFSMRMNFSTNNASALPWR